MERLRQAIEELERQGGLDVGELSALADRLLALVCRESREATKRGDHLVEGKTPNGWVASNCRISGSSAADRLRVGEQLENLPRLAGALRSGEIGYQATAVICHLSDLLGEKRGLMEEEEWIGYSKQFSIKSLRRLAEHARFVADPDGAERDNEENYELRYLFLSELGSMYKLDAVLDRECGMALKTALESLTKRLGPTDGRTPRQRRADAFKEMVIHALDSGSLPRRNGARPHLAVQTTPEGIKGELADGTPISGKSVQRLACDCTMHRVLMAESMVIDVGRAERTAQPAQWAGDQSQTPDLCGAWLRAADRLDPGPPPRVLVGGWRDQRSSDGPALLLPPPPGPRRWMAGGDGRRARGVHPAGITGDAQAPLGRVSPGGLDSLSCPSSGRKIRPPTSCWRPTRLRCSSAWCSTSR